MATMEGNIIGERIKSLREKNRLTQTALAERLHVSVASISAYEAGIRTPSVIMLRKLAGIFRISVDYLIGAEYKHQIDVSGLTWEQRNTVQEIVDNYVTVNSLPNPAEQAGRTAK